MLRVAVIVIVIVVVLVVNWSRRRAEWTSVKIYSFLAWHSDRDHVGLPPDLLRTTVNVHMFDSLLLILIRSSKFAAVEQPSSAILHDDEPISTI
jgi:hypothetical protein